MFHPARHDDHLPGLHQHMSVAEVHAQYPLHHHQRLIGFRVAVPDKVAGDAHDLELIVIHFGHHFGLPLFAEQGKFLSKINELIHKLILLNSFRRGILHQIVIERTRFCQVHADSNHG